MEEYKVNRILGSLAKLSHELSEEAFKAKEQQESAILYDASYAIDRAAILLKRFMSKSQE